MQVNCFYRQSSISLDGVEENLSPLCSYFISQPITSDKVTQSFPLTLHTNPNSSGNEIHFRVKISGKSLGMGPVDYLWLDLPYNDDNLSLQDLICDQSTIEVLCLFTHPDCDIFIEPIAGQESHDSIISSIPSPSVREERASIPLFRKRQETKLGPSSSSGQGDSQQHDYSAATIQSVKKGASNLWKAVLSTAEKLQQTTLNNLGNAGSGVDPDNANFTLAHQTLSRLCNQLSTPYADEAHSTILVNLFRLQCKESPVVSPSNVESPAWKTAGWQTNHPKADLKSSGLLALQSMVYFSEHYSKLASDMINRNRANTKAQYPFAIVGVNLTLLLADILQLRNDR
jgi:hypothetical protein